MPGPETPEPTAQLAGDATTTPQTPTRAPTKPDEQEAPPCPCSRDPHTPSPPPSSERAKPVGDLVLLVGDRGPTPAPQSPGGESPVRRTPRNATPGSDDDIVPYDNNATSPVAYPKTAVREAMPLVSPGSEGEASPADDGEPDDGEPEFASTWDQDDGGDWDTPASVPVVMVLQSPDRSLRGGASISHGVGGSVTVRAAGARVGAKDTSVTAPGNDSDDEDEDWDDLLPKKTAVIGSALGGAIAEAGPLSPAPPPATTPEVFLPPGQRPDGVWCRFGSGKLALGGSREDDGALPELSCLSCGFAVLRFRGAAWSSRADYMWFRNYNGHSLNIPRLTAMLVRPRGDSRSGGGGESSGVQGGGSGGGDEGAAYACQCSWQSIGRSRKELSPWGTNPLPEGGAANGSLRWQKKAKGAQHVDLTTGERK